MFKSIKPFGTGAFLLEWDQIISDEIQDEISFYLSKIKDKSIKGIVDVVAGYASITIFFQPELIKSKEIEGIIYSNHISSKSDASDHIWEIPVKYSSSSEKDMKVLMDHTGLSRGEIVNIHHATYYKVCFLGFLPGFLYLSGLDTKLHIPRKAVPDLNISKGSVAIGGQQTGIYPQNSPGGWYIIGQTDFRLINFYQPPYCKIKTGDIIRFTIA